MSSFGEVGRLPPAVGLPVLHLGGAEQLCVLDYLYYTLVELSSLAVGFHELMDSKNVNHLLVDCSQWPYIHFCYISIRYLIGPICGGSVLRSSMQRTLLILRFTERVY